MAFENPLAEALLEAVEGQEPVAGFAQHRSGTAQSAFGVDEVGGVERCSAGLALVAVGTGAVAVGTFAGYVAVSQKHLGLRVVELCGGLLHELALLMQAGEELRCCGRVDVAGGARVHIEAYAEFLKAVLDDFVIAVYHILRGNALVLSLDGDRHTVLIAAADHGYGAPLQAQVSGINVGRHINAGQMSYVYRAVGVRKCGGYEGTFILFHRDYVYVIMIVASNRKISKYLRM